MEIHNNPLILLDPGHGTRLYMKGAKQSPDGSLYEGEWTREIAAMLKEALWKEGLTSTILVTENSDISLSERCKRANAIYAKNKTAFLVSIHINAAGADGKWHTASGFSPWVYTKASSKSKQLAKILQENAEKAGLKGNRAVPKEKYWTANFYILKNTNCPAVLTENLFQDNKEEVKFLLSKEGKEKIVLLHVKSIKEYLNEINSKK